MIIFHENILIQINEKEVEKEEATPNQSKRYKELLLLFLSLFCDLRRGDKDASRGGEGRRRENYGRPSSVCQNAHVI